MKAKPARLDADKKAKPLTKIKHHAHREGVCHDQRLAINNPSWESETGEKIQLAENTHEDLKPRKITKKRLEAKENEESIIMAFWKHFQENYCYTDNDEVRGEEFTFKKMSDDKMREVIAEYQAEWD